MENGKNCNDGGYDDITSFDDCKEAFEKIEPHPKKTSTASYLTVKNTLISALSNALWDGCNHLGKGLRVSVNIYVNLTANVSVSVSTSGGILGVRVC